jgi:hypothetical protein
MMIAPLIINSFRRVYGGRSIPEDIDEINNSSALSQAARLVDPRLLYPAFQLRKCRQATDPVLMVVGLALS